MKLYYSPGLCSLAPHIAIREAALADRVEFVRVDTSKHTLPDGRDFLAIHPNGYVPVLELDDGELLTEGPAIQQYLADLAPASKLAPPADTLARTRLHEWLGYINSELHKAMSPLFDASLPESVKQPMREKIGKRLAVAADRLDGKTWVLGDRFTVADAYLYVVLSWGRFVGIDIGRWPRLKEHHARVGERPAVRDALRFEAQPEREEAPA